MFNPSRMWRPVWLFFSGMFVTTTQIDACECANHRVLSVFAPVKRFRRESTFLHVGMLKKRTYFCSALDRTSKTIEFGRCLMYVNKAAVLPIADNLSNRGTNPLKEVLGCGSWFQSRKWRWRLRSSSSRSPSSERTARLMSKHFTATTSFRPTGTRRRSCLASSKIL